MRIVRFRAADGRVHYGNWLDEQRAAPLLNNLFDGSLQFASEPMRIEKLLPPIEPPNIFAIGRNYKAHAAETGSEVPELPLIFMKATTALLPPGDAIEIPESAPNEVDFEAELAIVIGRAARRVSEADAMSYVFGFTAANDVSARDCQRNDKQWARAKGFDTFCPLGPCLVTRDEIDPNNVDVRSRLNGEGMQSSNTRHMLHSPAKLVSYLSRQFTLLPGTLILTGTPEGVGMARMPPVFLKDGDVIEVDVGGIGVLRNTVRGVSK